MRVHAFRLLGAGLGAAAGALFRSERWESVPLGRLGFRLSPILGAGLGPVVSLAL